MTYIDERRSDYIRILRNELPVLRAMMKISQAELARGVGISRQTYSLIETGKQEMSWVTFMAMLAFFGNNAKARKYLEGLGLVDKMQK